MSVETTNAFIAFKPLLWKIFGGIGEVLPYHYEPEVGGKGTNISDESDSDRESNSSSSSEETDQEFETANAWRLQTLSWCKCGHCTIMTIYIKKID